MKYQANPVIVDAFKIVSVSPVTRNGNMAVVTDDGQNRQADAPMLARLNPTIGDYWVIQEDGYEYLNPKAVFERKYSPAEFLSDPVGECYGQKSRQ